MTPEELKELGIELNEEQMTALLAKHQSEVEATVNGLKSKNSELLGTQKQLKERLEQYKGIDANEAFEALKKQQELADKKLIDEGKLDELVIQRTGRMKEDFDKKLAEANQKAETAREFAENFRQRVLSDEIRAVASTLDVIPSAIDDAIGRSKGLFTVDDEGNVIPTETAGLDAKGNPLTAKAWLESMRDKAPHWFPIAQGAGATGNNSGKATKKWGDYTELERAAIARDNPDEYKRLLETRGK